MKWLVINSTLCKKVLTSQCSFITLFLFHCKAFYLRGATIQFAFSSIRHEGWVVCTFPLSSLLSLIVFFFSFPCAEQGVQASFQATLPLSPYLYQLSESQQNLPIETISIYGIKRKRIVSPQLLFFCVCLQKSHMVYQALWNRF